MTDLVSLFFIAMIPIDCKISNISLYLFVFFSCFFHFFDNKYNIGEFICTTLKERMATNTTFVGATLIN